MANIFIKINGHEKLFDVVNTAMLFWPGSKIFDTRKRECDIFIHSSLIKLNGQYRAQAVIYQNKKRYSCQKTFSVQKADDMLKYIKQTLFTVGVKATGVTPPWGILTGIRPMNVYEKLEKSYPTLAGNILQKEYFVSEEKSKLLDEIYSFRQEVYYPNVSNDVSLYISIPFCPSKCLYCSFVSSAVERVKHLIDPYLDLLMWEIENKIHMIYAANKEISTIYIGGGTPGVLTPQQIDRLLSFIFSKLKAPLKEFCFEIGRPETVTAEKLSVLKKYPVNRLCINCQTLNDDILQNVGRKHTAEQFCKAVFLAKKFDFECINVDLIAGLPNETTESHIASIKQVLDLAPENITIHTLSIKKASTWSRPNALYDPKADSVTAMLSKGYKLLQDHAYLPYYIYRQKNTLSNGENIGYAINGHIGKYNIYMMEDVHSVFGCGAGASTKLILPHNGRIERFVNTKYPQEYLKFPDKLKEQLLDIQSLLCTSERK